jgi:raffinose/stachyose/melibiose transport system permease protein
MRLAVRNKIAINIALALITVLLVIPLWYALNNSFKEETAIYRNPLLLTPRTFTFENIRLAFEVMNYPRTILNSTVILIITSVLFVCFGALAGFGIAIVKSRILTGLYTFLVAIMTLPFQLAMIPLVTMLKNMALINTYFGTAFVFVGFLMPFVVFLYTGFIRTIPRELEDAARVDGCNLFATFVYIYFPLLKTITGTVLILRAVPVWNYLLIPLITTTKSSMATLPLKLYAFVSNNMTRWDLIFGSTFLVTLPIMIIFLLMQRFFVRAAVSGAVKG